MNAKQAYELIMAVIGMSGLVALACIILILIGLIF